MQVGPAIIGFFDANSMISQLCSCCRGTKSVHKIYILKAMHSAASTATEFVLTVLAGICDYTFALTNSQHACC